MLDSWPGNISLVYRRGVSQFIYIIPPFSDKKFSVTEIDVPAEI
jgi:hypothetical protein